MSFKQSRLVQLPYKRQLNWLYKALISIKCSVIFYLLNILQATAQIAPDNTLPSNSSVSVEGNSTVITGGTQAGSNLFHSFEHFSVPTGGTAYFNNSLEIQNIFSRVTGGVTSNIDGLIRANGNANLFFINPNGIIFGPNASLNIGGSFFASTANSVNFADGIKFSADASQATPLLTISVPVGLGFGSNSGSIQAQGNGQGIRSTTDLIDTSVGLRVQPNQTLALLGSNVTLQGATLKTVGGRIELGSVAGPALVSLTPIDKGYALGYLGVANFSNLSLFGQTAVDASGVPAGDIQLAGREISVAGGSQVESSALGSASGGTLNVTATELVELVGASSNAKFLSSLGTSTYPGTTGNGGNTTIETGRLSVRDGAQIGTATYGAGSAGNVFVKAKDSVELVGALPSGRFVSGIITAAQRGSTGNSGSLTLETGSLSIRDGATISTTAFSIGSPGLAGSISIKAKGLMELAGVSAGTHTPSSIVSSTNRGTTGNGGNISIETGSLSVRDGSQIGSATFGSGPTGNVFVKAKDSMELVGVSSQFPSSIIAAAQPGSTGNSGSLTLETGSLSIRDGALVGVGTSGAGSAGNLLVRAKDSVELVGSTTDGRPSRLSVRTAASGNAGDLRIETGQLTVRDGASVSATSEGIGEAGQLRVQAKSIQLENQAKLNAESFSGEGGNIFLRSQNLQLRRGSSITTDATGGSGNGGNITINTGTLAALPNENSDINANAIQGRGGNIRISTQGLFGIQFREQPTSSSDITASSKFGLNGVVDVRVLGFDPRNTLTPFTTAFIPTEKVMEKSCLARQNKQRGRFVVTGGGALPATPNSGISEFPLLGEPEVTAQPSIQQQRSRTTPESTLVASSGVWKVGDPIVEAQGLAIAPDGSPVLSVTSSQAKTPNPQDTICR